MADPACSADSHAALKADSAAFALLPLVGILALEESPPVLELRSCSLCQSTLAVEVPREDPPSP